MSGGMFAGCEGRYLGEVGGLSGH